MTLTKEEIENIYDTYYDIFQNRGYTQFTDEGWNRNEEIFKNIINKLGSEINI